MMISILNGSPTTRPMNENREISRDLRIRSPELPRFSSSIVGYLDCVLNGLVS